MTILAPGGMGKTRIAIELASRYVRDVTASSSHLDTIFTDGVYFIDLSAITEAEQIVPTIAGSLSFIIMQESRSQKQQLLDYLASKQMLLIFDNFENFYQK